MKDIYSDEIEESYRNNMLNVPKLLKAKIRNY